MTSIAPTIREHGLQFGRFVLYPAQRLLVQDGRPVRIGGRALDILMVMVQHAGEILDKDQLIQRVWGQTVVEDINLRVHIAALRRALGEGRTGERYIANVPLRGYGFVGVIEAVSTEPAPPALVNDVNHRLPVLLMGLEGRDLLIEQLVALGRQVRLLTLVGPGGMGKTSTAIRVAERLAPQRAGSVCFVDLSQIDQPEAVEPTLRNALAEGHAPSLLLLDNCEHLIEAAAAAVEALLRECPRLCLLATSREPLRAEAEHLVRLPPLAWPDAPVRSVEQALGYPAVRLFVRRAKEAGQRLTLEPAQLELIGQICQALDGIPLAIEMAARQVDLLGLGAFPALLDSPWHLSLPGRRTAPARHQSLHATWAWSIGLLSHVERHCLRVLAGLEEGFTLDGAVAALEDRRLCSQCRFQTVRQLADKSLLSVELAEEGARYRVLHTVRAYLSGV